MDWTQRHQAAMDEVRPDYGINVDDAMTIPNFSFMERFLVIGGNDPNLFYKNIMKIIYAINRKNLSISGKKRRFGRNFWFIQRNSNRRY